MENNPNPDISGMRKQYSLHTLDENDVANNPFDQFDRWFKDAASFPIEEPNAMTLSTATRNGIPSSRVVLLKEFAGNGFTFFTNYQSRKGNELLENPLAALNFFWKEMERQVRITGSVEKISTEESAAYFYSRPRESQLGAHASKQSHPVNSKKTMMEEFQNTETIFEGRDIPLPENWGGFRVVPNYFEFWQGQPSRMHDRIAYTLQPDKTWVKRRLFP